MSVLLKQYAILAEGCGAPSMCAIMRTMERLRAFLLRAALALLLAGVANVAAGELHVSTGGDDRNPGTAQRPFLTLERARVAVLAQRKREPNRAITVWIAGGAYELARPFELGPEDSGAESAPVTYSAMPEDEVRLRGGRRLSAGGFTTVVAPEVLGRLDAAARGNVFQFDLRAFGMSDFGEVSPQSKPAELFFNGRALQLARWPNEGFVRLARTAGRSPFRTGDIEGDRTGVFVYDGDRPSRWVGEPDLWLHGYWFWDWRDQYQRVGAIDVASKTITMQPPHHVYGYRDGARYYAINALVELDQPGEWYLDRARGLLYLWPPERLDRADIVLSVLRDPVVALHDASHVVLRGLTIEAGRGAGVEIRGGEGVLLADCTVRNVGGDGIVVSGGAGHSVVGCEIHQTGAGGIVLSGGDRASLRAAGHTAANNHIHHFARRTRTYAPAIKLEGVGQRVANNLIHDAPHVAVWFSGNDHVMELNEVHDVCNETRDAGAFYTGRDWSARGNIVRHNYIRDVQGVNGAGAQAIYLDDAASGTLVFGNLLRRTRRAMLIGGGRENVVENNVMVDCADSIVFDDRGLNWMKESVRAPDGIMVRRLLEVPYDRPPWSERYPRLVSLLRDDPGAPKYNAIRFNVLYRCKPMQLARAVVSAGAVRPNLDVGSDPGFVDERSGDFRLRPDSLVLHKFPKFEEIPIARIGLLTDVRGSRHRQKKTAPEGAVSGGK
jgi:parallel beta helix pectate lyase-like protein